MQRNLHSRRPRESNDMKTQRTAACTGSIERYWAPRELVMVGVFAAAAKLSSLLIALAGGGMNPVSLVAKNLVFTTLLVVLLTKVPKAGTLLLFTVVSMLISVLLLGGSMALLPAALAGALLGEAAAWGLARTTPRAVLWAPWLAAGVYDLASKGLSLGVSYLFMRESPVLMTMVVPIVALGYVGSVMGLWFGWKTVGELKHAGFVR